MAAFPSLCAPQKSPDRQHSGLAATHGGAGDQECVVSSVWVRVTATSKKARRTGAVLLHLYAASYGQRLLRKACHLPSLVGPRSSC